MGELRICIQLPRRDVLAPTHLLAVDRLAAGTVTAGELLSAAVAQTRAHVSALKHKALDAAVEGRADIGQLGALVVGLVAEAEVLKVGRGLVLAAPRKASAHLGHDVVEELKLDAAGGLAADADVKVGDLVGHCSAWVM
jgi:hypothetical protein